MTVGSVVERKTLKLESRVGGKSKDYQTYQYKSTRAGSNPATPVIDENQSTDNSDGGK